MYTYVPSFSPKRISLNTAGLKSSVSMEIAESLPKDKRTCNSFSVLSRVIILLCFVLSYSLFLPMIFATLLTGGFSVWNILPRILPSYNWLLWIVIFSFSVAFIDVIFYLTILVLLEFLIIPWSGLSFPFSLASTSITDNS